MEITRYTLHDVLQLRNLDYQIDTVFNDEIIEICNKIKANASQFASKQHAPRGWRDNYKGKDKFNSTHHSIGELDPSKKIISLLLNKLSNSNKDSIKSKLIEEIAKTKNNEILCFLLDKLFQCASIQVNFCNLYAEVCHDLHIQIDSIDMSEYIQSMIKDKMSDLENYRNSSKLENYDDFCEDLSWKNKHKGFYQLLTHFYIRDLLDIGKLQDVLNQIKSLIHSETNIFKTEVLIESLSMILKTISDTQTINVYHKKNIVHISENILTENKDQMNMRSRCILEMSIDKCR